jgi:hypothetical protein
MAGRFQFSIRMLLLATALIASALGAILAKQSWQAGLWVAFVAHMLPSAFLAGALYTRGPSQAFCAGAVFPATAALLFLVFESWATSSSTVEDPFVDFFESIADSGSKNILTVFWSGIPVIGILCMTFRWLLKPPA